MADSDEDVVDHASLLNSFGNDNTNIITPVPRMQSIKPEWDEEVSLHYTTPGCTTVTPWITLDRVCAWTLLADTTCFHVGSLQESSKGLFYVSVRLARASARVATDATDGGSRRGTSCWSSTRIESRSSL